MKIFTNCKKDLEKKYNNPDIREACVNELPIRQDDTQEIMRKVQMFRNEGIEIPYTDEGIINLIEYVRREGFSAYDLYCNGKDCVSQGDYKTAKLFYLAAMIKGYPNADKRYKEISSSTVRNLHRGLRFLTKVVSKI